MGIYGNFAKSLAEEKISSEMNFENALLEIYSDVIESYESEGDTEVVEEGANLDMRAIWKEANKDSKEHIKKYKAYLKAEEYKKAASELDVVSKNLKKARDEIKKVDAESVGSAVLGLVASYLMTSLELIVPQSIIVAGTTITTAGFMKHMATDGIEYLADIIKGGGGLVHKSVLAGQLITKVGQIFNTISALIIFIKDIKTFINELKSDKEASIKNFNLYRNKLLRYMDDSIKKIDKYKDDLSKLTKAEKE